MTALKRSIKITYGMGQVAESVTGAGFNTFLFLYFNQVLGLAGTYCGLAIFIAQAFDAVTDPLAGSVSDSCNSRLGRRHPFMYASSIPLAIFFFLMFIPPKDLGQIGLFLWLTIFAVLTRGALTLFQVPHLALGSELSNDYFERTSIFAYRTAIGMLGGVIITMMGFFIFLPNTPEFPKGQLNPAGYPYFAFFCSIILLIAVFSASFGTRRLIPNLPKASDDEVSFTPMRMVREFIEVWGNASFRAIFMGALSFFLYMGVSMTVTPLLNTFFWGFGSSQLGMLAVPMGVGFMIGSVLTRRAQEIFDKRNAMIIGACIMAVFQVLPVFLRLLGFFPENGDPFLLPLIFIIMLASSIFGGITAVTVFSMMSDIVREHEYTTGKRRDGIFFAANSFSQKINSGLGNAIAGFLIDFIRFPVNANPDTVAHETLVKLGILFMCAAGLNILAAYCVSFYKISRQRHEEVMTALEERYKGAS